MDWLSIGISYVAGAASGVAIKAVFDFSKRSRNHETASGDGASQTSFKDIKVGGDFAGRDINKKS